MLRKRPCEVIKPPAPFYRYPITRDDYEVIAFVLLLRCEKTGALTYEIRWIAVDTNVTDKSLFVNVNGLLGTHLSEYYIKNDKMVMTCSPLIIKHPDAKMGYVYERHAYVYVHFVCIATSESHIICFEPGQSLHFSPHRLLPEVSLDRYEEKMRAKQCAQSLLMWKKLY